MDRDHELRADARDRLGSPRRVEMPAAAEVGPPAPDRDEPDVDGSELAHLVEEVGVAGEVDRLRARDDVAERLAGRSDRAPASVVLGGNGTNLERADRERLTLLDLEHALEPALAQHSAEPARDDDGHLLAELLERGQVEVVVVRVRDEDGIDTAARSRGDRSRAP